MRSACLFSLILFIGSAMVFAQDRSGTIVQANTVYAGADGRFEAAPDTAVIQMNISVQDTTAQVAYERASKEVDQVRQVLRSNRIDPKAATIGFFSVQPVYEWKPKQHVTGYRVSSDVTLKLRDFSKIAPITQQLADANVSESQTLNYTLENIDDAKNRAVEDAYRRAHNHAEALARAAGRTLGELSYATVDTFEQAHVARPMARSMAAAAAAAPPAPTEEFTPQNVTVSAHVTALFNLK